MAVEKKDKACGMKSLLVEHVYKHFQQGSANIPVLTDLSFEFDLHKSYAIIGASGTGKSTLLYLLGGVESPDRGAIVLNGVTQIHQLKAAAREKFWNHSIGFIFQQPCLIDELTVLENVMLKGLISGQPEAARKAQMFLSSLGLENRLHFYPINLSKGEQQRVSIARAMMCEVELIIADEPTASLDQETGLQVINQLVFLARQRNIGLIVSTHDEYVSNLLDVQLELLSGMLVVKK